jgi:hypothetical protein
VGKSNCAASIGQNKQIFFVQLILRVKLFVQSLQVVEDLTTTIMEFLRFFFADARLKPRDLVDDPWQLTIWVSQLGALQLILEKLRLVFSKQSIAFVNLNLGTTRLSSVSSAIASSEGSCMDANCVAPNDRS